MIYKVEYATLTCIIDFTVTILIGFIDHLIDLCIGELLAYRSKPINTVTTAG